AGWQCGERSRRRRRGRQSSGIGLGTSADSRGGNRGRQTAIARPHNICPELVRREIGPKAGFIKPDETGHLFPEYEAFMRVYRPRHALLSLLVRCKTSILHCRKSGGPTRVSADFL